MTISLTVTPNRILKKTAGARIEMIISVLICVDRTNVTNHIDYEVSTFMLRHICVAENIYKMAIDC